MFNFEKLNVWQKAIDFADLIYKHTREFPTDERFGLTSQMRRAAVSVPSNIAEGHGRQSRPDYIRFLKTARGSLMELQTQSTLAIELGFLKGTDALGELSAETDRVLQGLIRGLEKLEH